MVGIAPILFVFWKLVKRTKFVKSSKADLVWEAPLIDAYEASFTSPPLGFWKEILGIFTFGRGAKDERMVTEEETGGRRASVVKTV
jgi:amino acid transporter